jgi:hypothetical protein
MFSRSMFLFVTPAFVVLNNVANVADAFTSSPAVSFRTPTTAVGSPRLQMSDDFVQETSEDTHERIQALVDNHPVLLFMKGSKLFPQVRSQSVSGHGLLQSRRREISPNVLSNLPLLFFFYKTFSAGSLILPLRFWNRSKLTSTRWMF